MMGARVVGPMRAVSAWFASGVIVALLSFGVYVATLSAHPSWDSLRYAAMIAFDTPAGLVSAHHLLGGPLAYGIYRVARLLGVGIEPLRILQMTSALSGAVAVGGLCALLRRVGAGTGVAVSAAMGLASSLAFWDVATDGEVYALAAAMLVAAWWALLGNSSPFEPVGFFGATDSLLWKRRAREDFGDGSFRQIPLNPPFPKGETSIPALETSLPRLSFARIARPAVCAGAFAAVATLGHQFNAVVVFASPLWFRRCEHRCRLVAAYLTGFCAVVVPGYLLAWHVSSWAHSWHGLYAWVTQYLHLGLHFPPRDHMRGALYGFLASLVPLPAGLGSAGGGRLPLFAADVITLTVLATVCIVGWRSTRAEERGPASGLSAVAAIAAVVLAAWWEPNSRKFWVPALVCGWLAIGLALARLAGARVVALALTVMALASLNLGAMILSRADPTSNPFPATARQIAAITAAADLIVVGSDLLGPSLAYYGARPHVTNVFALALDAKYRGRNVRQQLRQAIDEARRRGGRVFVSSDALGLPPDRRAMVSDLPGTIDDLMAPMRVRPALAYSVGGIARTLLEVNVNEGP